MLEQKFNTTTRITLTGTWEEKIIQSLKYAGWFPGRKTNNIIIDNYYKRFDIELSDKAKEFVVEYYGIKENWYIETTNMNWGADFEFRLFPYPQPYMTDAVDFMYDDAKYTVKSEEYESVLKIASQDNNIIMVGEVGYYYPARVWIGESGKIYATHDYEEDVLKFDTIVELIKYELQNREFTSVAMK